MNSLLRFKTNQIGFVLMLLLISTTMILAQQIGGPYTVDANTMLLMHFDGNLQNESPLSADGVQHGNPNSFYYLANTVSDLNQCLRIDNGSQTDTAFVTVADTAALDLTGSWTIEGWINIFTFGTGGSDWRWVPRLVIKTGDVQFYYPNYFVEMWGSSRFFSCGYFANSQDQWPQANSPNNTFAPGSWYHLTFIRDTTRHLLLNIVHDANRDLVSFATADYLSFGATDPTPITTNQPLHIGFAGGGGDSYLDGFVDEIRVSNVVREVPIPPIIVNVTTLSNQTTSVPQYEVGADIYTLFSSSSIQNANLYYSTSADTNWTAVPMTTVSGDSMMGVIPQQSLGTIIRYYLEAVDNNGLTYLYPQNAGWLTADYLSFGIYEPMTQTLDLTFEEGSGTPVDNSAYGNPVTPTGTPSFSSNAAAGQYSIYLEGDSSFVDVDAPFLAAKEFLLDYWMYPEDSMAVRDYCRIISRPRSYEGYADNNYRIRFNPDSRLSGGVDGAFEIVLDDSMKMDQWYHIMFEVRDAPAGDTVAHYGVLRLSDANDQVIEQKYLGFDEDVVEGFAPLRIGKSGPAAPGSYPPFFKGNFDDIKIYNYPAAMLSLENIIAGIGDEPGNAPLRYELSQNYPNPFNPNTDIKFTIPRSGKVKIVVYDMLGREVKVLANETMNAGVHHAVWDGTDLMNRKVATGVYFYRFEAKNFTQTRKMMLMK